MKTFVSQVEHCRAARTGTEEPMLQVPGHREQETCCFYMLLGPQDTGIWAISITRVEEEASNIPKFGRKQLHNL